MPIEDLTPVKAILKMGTNVQQDMLIFQDNLISPVLRIFTVYAYHHSYIYSTVTVCLGLKKQQPKNNNKASRFCRSDYRCFNILRCTGIL